MLLVVVGGRISAKAEVLPLQAHRDSVYMLRASVNASGDFGQQGIWRYDTRTSTFVHVAPFVYRGPHTDYVVNLAAGDDTILVTGSDLHEFELLSGRLLRRYELLPSNLRSWKFRGTLVSNRSSVRLAVEPGLYGFLECASGNFCPSFVSDGAGEVLHNDPANRSRIFHRSIVAEDRRIRWAFTFPEDPTAPHVAKRFVASDTQRHGMLSWSTLHRTRNVVPLLQDLHLIEGIGTTGSELTLLRRVEYATEPVPETLAFTYVPSIREFFRVESHRPPYSERLLIRELPNGEQHLVDRWTQELFNSQTGTFTDALAAISGETPPEAEQIVPVVGSGPGANSTYWRSDLFIFNPSANRITVSLRRVSRPDARTTVELAPAASTAITDVLAVLGGGPLGDGVTNDALVITAPYAWGQQLSVYSRTYTVDTEGGTFGQAVPAIPGRLGYSNHHSDFRTPSDSVTPSHSSIILDKRNPNQFRHNIGVVNDSPEPVTVRLRYAVVSPLPVTDPAVERFITVPPHSVSNTNIERLFPDEVVRSRPPRLWVAADRPLPIWVSAVDNLTGDATFVPYTLYALRGSADLGATIPAVVHSPGASGSFWRTDLIGLFPPVNASDVFQQPLAILNGLDCKATARLKGEPGVPLETTAYWHNIFPDVARQFGCDDPARLRAIVLPVSSWTAAYVRTFSTRADGGTYGEMLPLYPPNGWPVQHFAGVIVNDQFRANIGLHNGSDAPTGYTLRLFGSDGTGSHEVTAVLQPGETRQADLTAWFGQRIHDGVYGLSVIPEGEHGRSWAYVAIVDNRTNDPTIWW